MGTSTRALVSFASLTLFACGNSPPAASPNDAPAPAASVATVSPAPAAVTCPAGSTWDGHSCVGEVRCPEGTHFEKSIGCVSSAPLSAVKNNDVAPVPEGQSTAPPPPPAVGPIQETAVIGALPKSAPKFPQVFLPKSGFLRIHFPSDLAANPDSDNLTFVEPTGTSSFFGKDLVTFTTNGNPISQDPGEYARVLQGARAKALTKYTLKSFAVSACYRNVKGVEARWEFDENGTMMQGRACMFVHHRHGYSFMYAFDPKGTDEPRLRQVIEAVEVTD